MAKITLDIQTEQDINIAIGEEQSIDLDFGFDKAYTGTYEPVPSVNEQLLETANKRMLRDIKVQAIPVSRVPTPDNKGYTVTIG